MAMIWLAAAGAFLLVFLHPYVTYPLSLLVMPRVAEHAGGPVPTSATLVFAAYNEGPALPAKTANLRALKAAWPRLEIIAYCDAASDDTLAQLLAAGDVLRVISGTQRAGKAAGMRRLVAAAGGEIVVFVDANVLVDPASIGPLLEAFADPGVGGVAGRLRYVNGDASATARVGGWYWRLEECIKRLESRRGSIMGADGSIFALRRELYPVVPSHLLDDMIASLSVTLRGYRLIHSTQIIAFEKGATSSREEFLRKRRIGCRAFQTHLFLWPRLRAAWSPIDRYKYVSHKLLRWWGLMPLLLALGCAVLGLAAGGWRLAASAVAAASLLGAASGAAGVPGLRGAWQAFAAIAATFLGVTDALRGRRMQVWTPAASRN